MPHPVRISGSGVSFTLIGEDREPEVPVRVKFHRELVHCVGALKHAFQWAAWELPQYKRLIPAWVDAAGTEGAEGVRAARSQSLSAAFPQSKVNKLILLEYCFGPLPAGDVGFDDMVDVVQETLVKTLQGLIDPGLSITELVPDIFSGGKKIGYGRYKGWEFWAPKNFHVDFDLKKDLTRSTIAHEATHAFAGTKDCWGDNSYIDNKWDIYWMTHRDAPIGTHHPSKASRKPAGQGSTMYPPITDHALGLYNADSYATLVMRLDAC
jgi:hypothetical protein